MPTRAISRPLRESVVARRYGASGKGGRKRSAAELKADNAGVKDGTIRKGKGGRTVRKYNAKTGRWEILRVIDKKGRSRDPSKTEGSRAQKKAAVKSNLKNQAASRKKAMQSNRTYRMAKADPKKTGAEGGVRRLRNQKKQQILSAASKRLDARKKGMENLETMNSGKRWRKV